MDKNKIAFFASRKISSDSVLRCYDWATELPLHVIVVSGFQSKMEKDVLDLLLRTKHSALMLLARIMYKKVPEELVQPYQEGKLQIISTSSQIRQTRESAYNRNKKIIEMADEVIFASLSKNSSLYPLYEQAIKDGKLVKVF